MTEKIPLDDMTPAEAEAKLRALTDLFIGRLLVAASRAMSVAGFFGVAVQFRPDQFKEVPKKVRIRAAGTTADKERLMLTKDFTIEELRMTEMREVDAEFERMANALMARHLESRKQ